MRDQLFGKYGNVMPTDEMEKPNYQVRGSYCISWDTRGLFSHC